MQNDNSKLFKILVLHGGPKSSYTATETYLVANTEEEVFDWVNAKAYGRWTEDVEEGEEPETRWNEANDTEISLREWVMLNRGDLSDEAGWDDAYYGITKWGWELVEASQDDITVLVRLGITVEAKTSA